MTTNKTIEVQQIKVTITTVDGDDYICITDMAQAKSDASRAADVIKKGVAPI